MLLFELILDDGSVEDPFEAVKQLELTHDSVVIIEALSDDGSKSPFKLFDLMSEGHEVVIEHFLRDIHGVIGELSEIFHCLFELV